MGFQPEGIATAGEQFYVGSIPTGRVYAGSLRTGVGTVVVEPAAGRNAIGVDVDHGLLFVAGGPFPPGSGPGKAYVYDARTGADVAAYTFAPRSGLSFINDVVVTRDMAWFTDSFQPVLYGVPLGPGGRPVPGAAVTTLPLTGPGSDYQHVSGFNVNGIDATPNGKTLVIVQSSTGKLFTVDPSSGVAKLIDLGAATVVNGDGILLDGRTLYVVQNQFNQVSKIDLEPGLHAGSVVAVITSDDFSVPTTIDEHGSHLYVVNARFGVENPSGEYWVTRIEK